MAAAAAAKPRNNEVRINTVCKAERQQARGLPGLLGWRIGSTGDGLFERADDFVLSDVRLKKRDGLCKISEQLQNFLKLRQLLI